MEIIEAMTVSEGVTVVHINEEDDEAIPVSSLYWRQQYSVVEPKGLSVWQRPYAKAVKPNTQTGASPGLHL
ncbi:hypothetical protein MMC25_004814 [Agyrium rufum]|nr:hypothetical protein [Agyrium rufum]